MKNLNWLKNLDHTFLNKIKKIKQPSIISPMLATLTTDYFSDKNWLYEHKFDGVRCIAFKKGGVITLMSRNNQNMNVEYPELVHAILQQKMDNFIIDGEIVILNKKGISDFQLIQQRINLRQNIDLKLRLKKGKVIFCIFDLLYIDNYDIRRLPLYMRKNILKIFFNYNKILIYTEHKIGDGVKFFKKACSLGWEGIIAKRIDSEYLGFRSRDWLKFKCIMKQELVIGGYTDPKGSRKNFGALLVGYYEKEKFMYAGKVGTGYSEETLSILGPKLKKLEIQICPFNNYTESYKGVHWVEPQLVAEFQFAQWTNASRLRVGRYKGLREDKSAKKVVKEVPK